MPERWGDDMVLKINNVDIVPYIAFGGVKWQRNDVDDPDTGRDMSGRMHRGRVATKIRLDITCHIMNGSDLNTILNLIYPEYVAVEYDDPMYGRRTATMYSNNNPATYCMLKPDGTEYWTDITFPLVEV